MHAKLLSKSYGNLPGVALHPTEMGQRVLVYGPPQCTPVGLRRADAIGLYKSTLKQESAAADEHDRHGIGHNGYGRFEEAALHREAALAQPLRGTLVRTPPWQSPKFGISGRTNSTVGSRFCEKVAAVESSAPVAISEAPSRAGDDSSRSRRGRSELIQQED
jgi:hypothetical protein